MVNNEKLTVGELESTCTKELVRESNNETGDYKSIKVVAEIDDKGVLNAYYSYSDSVDNNPLCNTDAKLIVDQYNSFKL